MHIEEVHCCDHCNKALKIKSSMRRHEKKCYKDPANKACQTCRHFIPDTHEDDYYLCAVVEGLNGKQIHCEEHELKS
jgi:hypothetical protein